MNFIWQLLVEYKIWETWYTSKKEILESPI
jgi:hypothetical protein